MAEEDLNIEPCEPLELRMCMSDEWRDRLVVERLSQHIAYCPRVECGDQICRYFNWFHRHYNQCGKPDCRSCPKYRQWMTYHSKSCTYNSGCLLVHCSEFKMNSVSTMAEEDLNIEPREPLELRMCMSDEWRDRLVVERLSQHIAYCPRVQCGDQICRYFNWFPRHYNQCGKPDCRSCPKYRQWMTYHSKSCTYNSGCLLVHCSEFKTQQLRHQFRLLSQDAPEALTSTPRYRSQSSASSQGSFVDPEGSVGFRKDLAQIVTCDTTDKEDSKMESFHPQQRRETGGNAKMLIQGDSVNMLDFLRIPKKKQGETLDSKCDDSRRLSQNSTDADFYGSSHGSLPDSMESTEQTTLDEQLSLRHDGSHMQHDKETSMEDSGSTQTSSTTLVTGETLTSLSSTSSTQYLQHSLSSLSVSIAMSPATPTHDEQLSLRHCSSHGKMESFQPQQRRETGYLRGVDVIGETSITITSQAQTINWKGYGLKLHIPQDSLPPDFEQCKLIIKVLTGHFKFPENTSLVSAVYWLDSDPGIIFSKPLTLEIQHCASNTSRLSFVWAKCSQEHLPDTFKAVEKGEFFHENVYGRVQLNHFSLWGIVSRIYEWLSGKQLYCACLYYINNLINLRYIYFVITRNLEVDITYVKQNYSDKGATTDGCDEGMLVEFESGTISLKLPSDEAPLEGGWKIMPCHPPKITKNEVDTFNPGRRIPSCKLKAEWTKPCKPSPLTHKVNLEGAKDDSYFLIELNSDSTPPDLRKSSPGSTKHSHPSCLHEQPSSSSHHASISLHHHNGCPIQEWSSEPSIICRDDRPSLCKLLKFPDKCRRINIPEQISTNYREFGITLLNDHSGVIISGIEREKKDNAKEINQAILEKWIGGKGRQPVTWDTLVKSLRDIDLTVLADEIEIVLQSCHHC